MSIILRKTKGSELSYIEVDEDFSQFIYSSSIESSNKLLKVYYTGSSGLGFSPRSGTLDLNIFPYTGSFSILGSKTLIGNLEETGSFSNLGNFNFIGDTVQTGSFKVTGSIIVTGGGVTGSIETAISTSYSSTGTSASYSETLTSASYAETITDTEVVTSASYSNTGTSASYAENITTINTLSSASYSNTTTSASYTETSTSASYAETSTSASYSETITTAEIVTSASYSTNMETINGISSSQFLRSDEDDIMTGDLDITGNRVIEYRDTSTGDGESTPYSKARHIRLLNFTDAEAELDLTGPSIPNTGNHVFVYFKGGDGGYDLTITDNGVQIESLAWSSIHPNGSITGSILLFWDSAEWHTVISNVDENT